MVHFLGFCLQTRPNNLRDEVRLCVRSPARDRYQQSSSVCFLFQMAAPTELTSAMTSRMPNRTRICMLVTRSTFERFSGTLVEF